MCWFLVKQLSSYILPYTYLCKKETLSGKWAGRQMGERQQTLTEVSCFCYTWWLAPFTFSVSVSFFWMKCKITWYKNNFSTPAITQRKLMVVLSWRRSNFLGNFFGVTHLLKTISTYRHKQRTCVWTFDSRSIDIMWSIVKYYFIQIVAQILKRLFKKTILQAVLCFLGKVPTPGTSEGPKGLLYIHVCHINVLICCYSSQLAVFRRHLFYCIRSFRELLWLQKKASITKRSEQQTFKPGYSRAC